MHLIMSLTNVKKNQSFLFFHSTPEFFSIILHAELLLRYSSVSFAWLLRVALCMIIILLFITFLNSVSHLNSLHVHTF